MGQLGPGLGHLFSRQFGRENVLLSDIVKPKSHELGSLNYTYADVLDLNGLKKLVVEHNADWVVHLSALLSAVGERNVHQAISVNVHGMQNILELSRIYNLKVWHLNVFLSYNRYFIWCMTCLGVHSEYDWRVWTRIAAKPNARFDYSTSKDDLRRD